jgi:Mce-associated membrane protein
VSATSPSWYDVLDVDPSAGPEEIRAAWKAGIADLDPTDRRFRVLNQAAEVLLDPQARAEYDEARATTVVEEPAQRASRDQVSETPAEPKLDPPQDSPSTDSPGFETPARPSPAPQPPRSARTSTTGMPETAKATKTAGATAGRVVPVWVLAVLTVVAGVLVGLCVWQLQKPTDASVTEATRQAVAAAGPAAEAILSFDHRDLEGSQARAHEFMTDSYREEYDRFLEGVVAPNAAETRTTVEATALLSAVVRSGAARVQVLVYVDRARTNAASTTPEVFRDQVTLTMREVEGEWLVDEVATTPLSAG